MPQVRPLPELRRRYLACNITLMGTAILSFLYLFFNAAYRDNLYFGICALFVAAVGGCIVLDRVMIRRIKCPTCGRELSKEKAPPGKFISIQYRCDKCQTLWDTEAKGPEKVRYSDPL